MAETYKATHNCTVLVPSVRIRPENSTSNNYIASFVKNDKFQISEILPDMDDPTNSLKVWGRIFGGVHNGKFTALEYPSSGVPTKNSSYEPIPVDPSPPLTEIAETLKVIYEFESGDIVKRYRLDE